MGEVGLATASFFCFGLAAGVKSSCLLNLVEEKAGCCWRNLGSIC